MEYCNVEIQIDLFDYKRSFLKNINTDDLEYELKRRKEEDIYINDKKILYHDIDIDLSDFETDILDKLYNDELSNELKNRGFIVLGKNEYPPTNLATKNDICKILGLREWSTKEQILNELNNIL